MRKYIFTVTVFEGSDEWWESLDKMEPAKRIEEVKNEVYELLTDVGNLDCTVENNNYYQCTFDFGDLR
jgi:transcription initiation factor IIE alpha subunit